MVLYGMRMFFVTKAVLVAALCVMRYSNGYKPCDVNTLTSYRNDVSHVISTQLKTRLFYEKFTAGFTNCHVDS